MLPTHRIDGPAGAPVLMLGSSLGTTGDLWAPQMPMLTQRFRVVRYEYPGHGPYAPREAPATRRTRREEEAQRTTSPPSGTVPRRAQRAPSRPSIADLGAGVVELLDELGAERASLAGISLGGMVSMWVAAHAPDRVDRVVLACTAAHLPPASAWHERAELVRGEGTDPLRPALLARWFTEGFPAARPDVVEPVAAMLAAADPEGYASCCEAIAGMDLRGDLAAVVAPTLIIAGADDPVTPPAAALELHQAITGSALAVIPRAAHLANLEQPDAFSAAMLDHLTGLPVERGRATRRQVLGDVHVDRSAAGATPFDAPFLDLITRYAWGEIWTRPGLDRVTRSCITLAMLAALGRFEELPLHVRGAVRNGLTHEQIAEVLLQAAVYCGVPAANSAFAVAQRTLDELAAEAGDGADLHR